MKNLFIDMLGVLGIGSAISAPFIEKITAIGQLVAVLLGITLAIYSIIHKRKEIKRLDSLEADEKLQFKSKKP